MCLQLVPIYATKLCFRLMAWGEAVTFGSFSQCLRIADTPFVTSVGLAFGHPPAALRRLFA